jgi:hypothetical protein
MLDEIHPSDDELEAYILGSASDTALDKVEEHLLICERCRRELAHSEQHVSTIKRGGDGKRLRSIHLTVDGSIFGAIHSGADGKWIARHWGSQLDGFKNCDSIEEANAYLMDSFQQMFPEHLCSEECRKTSY